jgi:hypothetical protein
VAEVHYLGAVGTDQGLIQEEIKRRLNFGNDMYHSVQNLLSCHLLYEDVNIRIYKTVVWPVVLNGDQHRLGVFENRVQRRIFAQMREEMTGGRSKLCNEDHQNLYFTKYNQNDEVKEDEIGRAYSLNGVRRNTYVIGWKGRRKGTTRKTKMREGEEY